ncbi:MAG: ribosomal-processing cysteine protease Prp [Lachnospiraceae bacterium]
MIHITMYQNHENEYTAFNCIGHAEFAKSGEDIVCAAVSILVINTINSIEQIVQDKFDIVTNEKSGLIDFSLKGEYSKDSLMLLKSMVLGLQGIQNNYGNEYITLIFKEV